LCLADKLPTKTLILTLDDGFELGFQTIDIAEYLHGFKSNDGKPYPLPATFFVNGCRFVNKSDPNRIVNRFTSNCFGLPAIAEEQLDRVVALGHELAWHTYDHIDLLDWRLSDLERLKQMYDEASLVDRHYRAPYIFFRAPNLDWHESLARLFNSDQFLQTWHPVGPIGAEFVGAGRLAFDGKLVRGDWDCLRNYSPETCAQVYVDAIEAHPRHSGVILMHDRQPLIGASDKPKRILAAILARCPPGQYRYLSMTAAYSEALNYAKRSEFRPQARNK
jgi:peptidoglycan/xylan/chitin deacetylase (PgdA/CDA1 family)